MMLGANLVRDEWYLRCQLRIRPDDVRAGDIEKINVLLKKYMVAGDGALVYLCQGLLDLDRRRAANFQADRCFLTGLIDGVVDPLQDGVFNTLEPMFGIYEDNADMMPLVNQAATFFGDAVQTKAALLTARFDADQDTQATEETPVR